MMKRSGEEIEIMRYVLMLLLLPLLQQAYCEDKPVKKKAEYSASVSLNSNGIASIPAFSLGKPALIASLSVAKGRFSYDPVLAYSLNMKPWFFDSWLHYKIIDKPSFQLRTGFNFSNFFTQQDYSGEMITKGERYFAGEIAAFYRTGQYNTLSLMYWSDNGMEPGSISGHYLSFADDVVNVPAGRSVLLGASLQIFYIGYEGNNDGLFTSPKLTAGLRNVPVSVFFQATQVIFSNIEPNPGFKWNIGAGYSF
jgi:hypothetical protein